MSNGCDKGGSIQRLFAGGCRRFLLLFVYCRLILKLLACAKQFDVSQQSVAKATKK